MLINQHHTTSSRRRRSFLRVVSELDFHYIAVERAFLVEQGRRGRAEAVRAVVAAEATVSQPKNCSGLFSVLSDIGTRFSRSRISVVRSALFDVSLVPSATDLTAEVVQYEVSVSLDIVGANGWGTYDKNRP
jgi:hypothetical protein